MKSPSTASFDDWYKDNYARVLAAVHVICGDFAEAEDATHTAFVKALERWTLVSKMKSPVGWTVQVGTNSLRRTLLRRVRSRELLARARPATSTIDKYLDHELWKLVAELPERQRTAIVLRYIEGLTQQEIAATVEVAPGTVAATLNQARASIRESLGGRE